MIMYGIFVDIQGVSHLLDVPVILKIEQDGAADALPLLRGAAGENQGDQIPPDVRGDAVGKKLQRDLVIAQNTPAAVRPGRLAGGPGLLIAAADLQPPPALRAHTAAHRRLIGPLQLSADLVDTGQDLVPVPVGEQQQDPLVDHCAQAVGVGAQIGADVLEKESVAHLLGGRIGLPGAEGFQHLQDHHSPAGSDVDPQHIAPQLQFRLVGLLGEEPPLNEALAGAVQQILLSLPTGVPHHDLCHALEDSAQGVHLLRVPGDADDPYRLAVQLDGEVDARADAAGAAVLLDRQPGQLLGQDLAGPSWRCPTRPGSVLAKMVPVPSMMLMSWPVISFISRTMERAAASEINIPHRPLDNR